MTRENKINPSAVGSRIRGVRGELTLKEFGDMLGVKPPTVFEYEKDRVPDAEMLLAIAAIGKVSVDWLLTGYDSSGRVSDVELGYGKNPELINIVRDVKRVWLASDENARQLLRDFLRYLKRVIGSI